MTRLQTRNETRFTLAASNALLPIVESIVSEIVERRDRRSRLRNTRALLRRATTPEGLTRALSDLDARIWDDEDRIRRAHKELEAMGLEVLRLDPVVVHFPGAIDGQELVFCWEEGDSAVAYGHPIGGEQDPRLPLRGTSGEPE